MQKDNIRMIEELTGLSVLAALAEGDAALSVDAGLLASFYQ